MLATDLAHLAGGVMLVVALLMLAQRRNSAMIGAFTIQSAALVLAVIAQAVAHDRPWLGLVAVIVAGLQCVLIPLEARRIATASQDGSSPARMALGVAAVVLVQMALRAAAMPEVVAREDLSAALSVALLGLVAVVTRRDATGQMLGFMTAASGCTLAAVALPGLPVAAVLAGLTLLGTPALGVVLIRRLPAP